MKVNLETLRNTSQWEKAGVSLPRFDIGAMREATEKEPIWVHFGAGNIFRAYIAVLQQRLLNAGLSDRGIIAADTFDVDNIRMIYGGYDNLTMCVTLNADATIDKEIVASVSEALVAQPGEARDYGRLLDIVAAPSLQMISFTITEKGYALRQIDGNYLKVVAEDLEKGPETPRGTFVAPFVNAEKAQYLVIEDKFPNGRPPLEKAGVYFTDRDTVNQTERMKVTTCLNPLHTALAVYGCLLGYTLIREEMKDEDLVKLIRRLGYQEGLPVVTDPGILSPKAFIDEVVEQRLPNPFMPDAPQRIATDTSQKVGIRFGETIKSYIADHRPMDQLVALPLAIAGWLRYLLAVDDQGNAMPLSGDPLLPELQKQLSGIELGKPETAGGKLKPILKNSLIFGSDLTATPLAARIEEYFLEEIAGPGAVRKTLHKYLN